MSSRIVQRLAALDWDVIEESLWERGYAKTAPVLAPAECAKVVSLYPQDRHFRKRVDMTRLRFGVGDYSYLARPLPKLVAELRIHSYRYLAPISNRWMEALRSSTRFPPTLGGFLRSCAHRGQRKPTPLVLRYSAGGYNCLHQDLYGEIVFPLQLTCFLSRPGVDYGGGEFLLLENRARSQSRGEAIHAEAGEMLIFPSHERPLRGARGFYRARMRHGLSRVSWGSRYALGIIFHDAR